MARVSWTPQALEDLEEISRFVRRNSRRYADDFVDRVFEATDRVGRYPHSGRMVPEWEDEELREVLVSGYRIIYRVLAEEVEVLTLHHTARLLQDFP